MVNDHDRKGLVDVDAFSTNIAALLCWMFVNVVSGNKKRFL